MVSVVGGPGGGDRAKSEEQPQQSKCNALEPTLPTIRDADGTPDLRIEPCVIERTEAAPLAVMVAHVFRRSRVERPSLSARH